MDENLKPELLGSEDALFISADPDVYVLHMELYNKYTIDQCLEELADFHDSDEEEGDEENEIICPEE